MIFRRAALVIGVGLVLIVAAMPFATVRLHQRLLDLGVENKVLLLNEDDLWMAAFVAVVVVAVVLAGVLRKPVVLAWALLPVSAGVVWTLLLFSDIQFDTSFLSDEVDSRVNTDRSLAFGSYVTVIGMIVVVYGLAIPLMERRRQQIVSR